MTSSDLFISRTALLAIASCGMVALADIVAWTLLVRDYGPVSETISALAVGPGSLLLDGGLWSFAAGCVALGAGMFFWSRGGILWRLAALAVMLLGPAVGVIAFFNEYAGQQNAGADLHINAVYTLGVLVALAALLAVSPLKRLDPALARRSVRFGVAWMVLAPLFFVIPDNWDGAYERGLALMLLGWVAAMGVLLATTLRHDTAPE